MTHLPQAENKRHEHMANSFIKKSQKTPSEEMQRAKRYRADYQRRYLK